MDITYRAVVEDDHGRQLVKFRPNAETLRTMLAEMPPSKRML
jgi:hypothetical protein